MNPQSIGKALFGSRSMHFRNAEHILVQRARSASQAPQAPSPAHRVTPQRLSKADLYTPLPNPCCQTGSMLAGHPVLAAIHLVQPSRHAAAAAAAASSISPRRVPAAQPVRVALPPALHLDAPQMPCGNQQGCEQSLRPRCCPAAGVAGAVTGHELQRPPVTRINADSFVIMRRCPSPIMPPKGKPAIHLTIKAARAMPT